MVNNIDFKRVQHLREICGAGLDDCQQALRLCDDNMNLALEFLKECACSSRTKEQIIEDWQLEDTKTLKAKAFDVVLRMFDAGYLLDMARPRVTKDDLSILMRAIDNKEEL